MEKVIFFITAPVIFITIAGLSAYCFVPVFLTEVELICNYKMWFINKKGYLLAAVNTLFTLSFGTTFVWSLKGLFITFQMMF